MTTRVSATSSGFIRGTFTCDSNGNRLERGTRGDYVAMYLDNLFVTIDPHDEDGDNSGYEQTYNSGWNIEHISLEDHLAYLDGYPSDPGEEVFVRDIIRRYNIVDFTESFNDSDLDITDVTLVVLRNKYVVEVRVNYKHGDFSKQNGMDSRVMTKSGEILGNTVYQVDYDNVPFNVKTLANT